jgi:hypothetical protein
MNFDIKEEQLKRKQELKSLALEISIKKQEYKDAQREHQNLHTSFNIKNCLSVSDCWYDNGDILQSVRSIISKSIFQLNDLLKILNSLQGKYRILHTIYCLYNGTPLDKIEKRVYHYNVLSKMFHTSINPISYEEYIRELGRYWKWKYAFTASCVKWVDYENALNHQKLLEKRKMFLNLRKMNLY